MLEWLRKGVDCAGSILFRGTLPPRAEDFSFLERNGVAMSRAAGTSSDVHWQCNLSHPKWGDARIFCLRDMQVPPVVLIDWDSNLTQPEQELARAGRTGVSVLLQGRRENILCDRKHLLQYIRAIMGDDGVAAMDHTAMRFWSRDGLDDELSHDADVDIAALFTLHAVRRADEESAEESDGDAEDGGGRVRWAHTHGLAAVGGFDFDILNPADELFMSAFDAFRATAFAIVEGDVKPNTAKYDLAQPGGTVRFVEAAVFRAGADTALLEETGLMDDQDHVKGHAVLCEPAGGLLSRWSRGYKPSRFLSTPIPDGLVFSFSTGATDLMAERARGTYAYFQRLIEELRPFNFQTIVKLGYETDVGGSLGAEHLWFEVHEAGDRKIDATLLNEPHQIANMRQGQRGAHEVERLTDWTIMTPGGPIDPRSTKILRFVRDRREELLAALREQPRVTVRHKRA